MTYLFLDTNVLLHYRRLEEIDWISLAKSNEVLIVLCPVVIRELEEHKVNHPRNKFRKRAQEIITSLHSRFSEADSGVIRERVRLEFLIKDPSIDFGAYKLRAELSDDWLIASAIEWKQNYSSGETRIVSADFGISIKAKAQGISVLCPVESDKLPEEMDVDEKKIKELQKELAGIKNSLPSLKLFFLGHPESENFVRVRIPPPLAFDIAKSETSLNEIRLQYPPLSIPDEAQERAERKKLEKQFWKGNMNVRFPISGTEFERYNQELPTFYQSYETYLHKLHDYRNAKRRMISFEVGLLNSGTAPAEDIDVHLHFPDGFQLLNGDDTLPAPPSPPKQPPQPGTITVGGMFGGLQNIGRMNVSRPAGPAPNVSSPSIRRTNSYDVRSQIKKAKHGYNLRVAKFVAVFDSDESVSSFKIDYTISAANLPKAATGDLSVIIESES